jgi:peroxiredoxin
MGLKKLFQAMAGGEHMEALSAGAKAPDFSLTSTGGAKLSLSEALKKGPVVAAFFKISCPVCQFTFPFLERIYESYGDAKFTFWGVSQDDARDTRDFMKEFGVKFPVLIDDAKFTTSNHYGLTNVPSVFLIGTDGKIQVSSVGFAKADLENVAAAAARANGKAESPLFKPGEVVPDYKPG